MHEKSKLRLRVSTLTLTPNLWIKVNVTALSDVQVITMSQIVLEKLPEIGFITSP